MSKYLESPTAPNSDIKKAAILFAGGPAPAANAVISTAASSFRKAGIDVVGIKHGYSSLVEYDGSKPLEIGKDYVDLDSEFLARSRNTQGIMIGTARTNPGKNVSAKDHFHDEKRVQPFHHVYNALRSLGVDALVSIGGDDTLKTANKFKLYQEILKPNEKPIPVVHLPKTIDNDYHGIDFTFGFFTAVEFLASEIRNLIYDAQATGSYFLAETMGRSAGWLAYGAAIAGEASLVISVEDIEGPYADVENVTNRKTKEVTERKVMNIDRVVKRIVQTMLARDSEGKEFGVIVLAEGLAEFLPQAYIEGIKRDDHGHIAISDVNLCDIFTNLVSKEYERQTNRKKRVKGLQLGYESRCAKPHAFDVMLGSQLGVGAYRALVEENRNGVMVSVKGQLDLHFEPFENLVNPETLVTVVRYIKHDSDFQRLARFLETSVDANEELAPELETAES